MKILVSGFKPFADFNQNITEKLMMCIDSYKPGIKSVVLPVEYENAFNMLDALVQQNMPDFVIATGMASKRASITIEQIAVNINDSNTPDNAGVVKKDSFIKQNGPLALYTSELSKNIYSLSDVFKSYSAGTYVCNDIFYRLLHKKEESSIYPQVSFIHFPDESMIPFDTQLATFKKLLDVLCA